MTTKNMTNHGNYEQSLITMNKLTARSRGLPEKLTDPQQLKKSHTFYGT